MNRQSMVQNGVNTEMLATLLSLGFEENISRRALLATSNQSAEIATNWVLENSHDPSNHRPVSREDEEAASSRLSAVEEVYDRAFSQLGGVPTVAHKMIMVVRKDLGMTVGKVAAQCSHAAIGIYKRLLNGNPKLLTDWEREGQKKVVVYCNTEAELNELERQAIMISLPCHTVRDAGRTEIAAGSKTVLVVMGPDYIVDQVTGNLPLLH